jgi:hypothetical protein
MHRNKRRARVAMIYLFEHLVGAGDEAVHELLARDLREEA